MKHFLTLAVAVGVGLTAHAQDAIPSEEAEEQSFVLSHEELEDLVAPIALHPDALVALILPASTTPSEIVLAARYLESGGNPEAVDEKPWTDSVRGLARYPEVLEQLNKDLEWTIQLGDAFMSQPADVMEAIQRLRQRAQANGSLQSSKEQRVVVEEKQILIVPTRPDVIYVPTYDTRVVYVDYPIRFHRPVVRFSVGFRVGSWLTYDCDWYGRRIWWVDNRHYWRHHRDWRQPRFPRHGGYVDAKWRRPWTPPRHVHRPHPPRFDRPRIDPRSPQPPRAHVPPRQPRDARWIDRNRDGPGNRRQRHIAESRPNRRLQPGDISRPRLPPTLRNDSVQPRIRPGPQTPRLRQSPPERPDRRLRNVPPTRRNPAVERRSPRPERRLTPSANGRTRVWTARQPNYSPRQAQAPQKKVTHQTSRPRRSESASAPRQPAPRREASRPPSGGSRSKAQDSSRFNGRRMGGNRSGG